MDEVLSPSQSVQIFLPKSYYKEGQDSLWEILYAPLITPAVINLPLGYRFFFTS